MTDASKLESIIRHALSIKENLSPQSNSEDKKELKKRIETDLNVKFKGPSTIFAVLSKLVRTTTTTLVIAHTIIPLFKELIPCLFKSSSYGSTEINFMKIRNSFNDHPDQDVKKFAHETTRTTAEEKKKTSARAQARCLERLESPLHIDMDVFLENIRNGIKDNNFAPLMCALQAACGARNIELLNPKLSQFELSDEEGFVIQRGQAKSRKKEVIDLIEKPILGVPVLLFLERLEYARTFTALSVSKGKTNSQLGDLYQDKIVKHVKSLYPQFKSSDGSHRLRGAYVKISHIIHSNKDVSPTSWAKRVLGHSTLATAAHYDSIIIDRSPINININERVSTLEFQMESMLYSIRTLQQKKRKRIFIDSEEDE
jgi:integrase